MKTKRLKSHHELEQAVLKAIYFQVRDLPYDGKWRQFKQDMTYDGIEYTVSSFFKVDNEMFTYKELIITHKQQVITIPQSARLQ